MNMAPQIQVRYTVKRSTLTQALRVAAVRYATDAEWLHISDLPEPQRQRAVDAFMLQAKDTTTLADEIENVDTLVLVD